MVGVLLVPLGLSACGTDETGARSTVVSIQPSSYVVREPVTTTTAPATDDTSADIDEDGRSRVEQEYTVQSGDAVALIASRYGITAEDLANYNDWPSGINQPIYPGDLILIPPGALIPEIPELDAEAATPSSVSQTTLPGTGGECVEGTYILVAGDIPFRVAERFDITVDQLNAANANTPGYAGFVVGTEIKIPC